MKGGKQGLSGSLDIRGFFSSPPVMSKKSNTNPRNPQVRNASALGEVGTTATVACTPSSGWSLVNNNNSLPTPNSTSSKKAAKLSPIIPIFSVSSPLQVVGGSLQPSSALPSGHAAVPTTISTGSGHRHRPRSRRHMSNSSAASCPRPKVVNLTGSHLNTRSPGDSISTTCVVAETVVLADEEGGHKRNRSPAASPFEKIMLPPSASANAPANSVKTNRFFLEGPIPASRGGGGGGGSKVSGKANWKNVFGRYLLPPSGEIVVGRDSLRDTHPANNTKLRVGIDKREEGVSRSQVNLAVCASEGRVLVVGRNNSLNPVRLVRGAESSRLTAAEPPPVRQEINKTTTTTPIATRAVVTILRAGQRCYLYPGDVLQLDGFRRPGISTCSYVLRPLPPELVTPANWGVLSASDVALPAGAAPHTTSVKVEKPSRGDGELGSNPTVARRSTTGSPIISRGQRSTPKVRKSPGLADHSRDGSQKKASGATSRPLLFPAKTTIAGKSSTPLGFAGGEGPPLSPSATAVNAGIERDSEYSEDGSVATKKLRMSSEGGSDDGVSVSLGSASTLVKLPPSAVGRVDHHGPSSTPGEVQLAKSIFRDTSGSVTGRVVAEDSAAVTPSKRCCTDVSKGNMRAPSSSSVKAPRTSVKDRSMLNSVDNTGKASRLSKLMSRSEAVTYHAIGATQGFPAESDADRATKAATTCAGEEDVQQTSSPSPLSVASPAVNIPVTVKPEDRLVSSADSPSVASRLSEKEKAEGAPMPTREKTGVFDTLSCPAGVSDVDDTSWSDTPALSTAPRKPAVQLASADVEDDKRDSDGDDKRKVGNVKARERFGSAVTPPALTIPAVTASGKSWNVDDFVELEARTSKGINKLGGVARVVSVFDDGTYLVKLTLGGAAPTRVPSNLLHSYAAPSVSSSRLRRSPRNRGGNGEPQPDPSSDLIPPSPTPSSSSTTSVPPTACMVARVHSRSSPSSDSGKSPDDKKTQATTAASTTAYITAPAGYAVASESSSSIESDSSGIAARPGDRARVLYDKTDWYMGTVITVHLNGSEVTVRFDSGSEERVSLSPGDAEICADTELAPRLADPPPPQATRSPGVSGKKYRLSKGRAGIRAVQAIGLGRQVLAEGEGVRLTEVRARALLDTAPEKLVGLAYQEYHPGYGGGWETVISEISSERVVRNLASCAGGNNCGDRNKSSVNQVLWPESVVVVQSERSVGRGEKEEGEKEERDRDYTYTRKMGGLLARLKTSDKRREASSARGGGGVGEVISSGTINIGTSPLKGAAAASSRSSPRLRRNNNITAEVTLIADTITATKSSAASTRGLVSTPTHSTPETGKSSAGVGRESGRSKAASRTSSICKHAVGKTDRRQPLVARAATRGNPPVDTVLADPNIATRAREGEGECASRPAKQSKMPPAMVVVNNKNVTAAATLTKKGRKVTVEERERPTCPICCCVFYATERPEDVNKHLAACSRKATEATPQEEKYQEEAKTAEAAVIVSRPLSVMSPLFSRALVVGVCGNDLGSLAASVEELASRRVQPRPILCDRVMQGLLKSRCRFQTEYLRRIIKGSLRTFPDCWQPLNWGCFEETLQQIAAEDDRAALNAHTTAVSIILDCIQAKRLCRQRRKPTLLFLGAGTDRDGRTAVKRCAKWAAKSWARRGAAVHAGNIAEARACAAMSRALSEAMEAFICGGELRGQGAAGGSGVGLGGVDVMVVEGCEIIAIELEAHGEAVDEKGNTEMTARGRAGLLRSLAGRSFFPILAEVILQSMSGEENEGGELDRLKALLVRRAGGRGGSGIGAGDKKIRERRERGRAVAMSGSTMLLEDMAV